MQNNDEIDDFMKQQREQLSYAARVVDFICDNIGVLSRLWLFFVFILLVFGRFFVALTLQSFYESLIILAVLFFGFVTVIAMYHFFDE